MSNAIDCAQYFLGLGDSCPSLDTVKNALTSHAPPALPPLPDGVVWDPSNTGAVNFTNAADPAKRTHPYLWYPAKNCVAKGTPQYAQIEYNCTTLDRMLQWGGGFLPVAWYAVVPVLDLMTGLPTYQPQGAISPPGTTIPTKYAPYEDALAFVNG